MAENAKKWSDDYTDEEIKQAIQSPTQEVAKRRREANKNAAGLFRDAMRHLFQNDNPNNKQ